MLAPLFDALEASRWVVVGTGPTAHVEMVEDVPVRLAAVRELLDRAYGRAHSTGTVTVITEDLLDQELKRLEAELAANDPDPDPGEDRRTAGEDPAADRTSTA